MSTVENVNCEAEPWLRYFPISFFAVVMGLGGLSLAWKSAAPQPLSNAYHIIGILTAMAMLLISTLYALKIIRHPQAVYAELRHPVRLNFFPAFSINLLLISAIWGDLHLLSKPLWMAGAMIQLSFTVFIMSSWINHSHYKLTHANPSWFIPVVGNIIIPVTGSHLGYTEISWFFYSIGIVFWLILFTIVLYRLFFYEQLPPRMTPMLFILLPPPFIGFVSYTTLIGEFDIFARILYYVGLFLSLLLLANIGRFLKIPFSITSWAYSFPIAAFTIATAKVHLFLPNTFFSALTNILLLIVTLLLCWLVVRTVKAVSNQEIFLPE